jgi:PhzF family phenazine biosynthesis protein
VSSYPFSQVDVSGSAPLLGNPVAVVHDATGLDDEQMAAFARWTNLSETTFLLPPTDEGRSGGADYRLRIFTPGGELPFAGHPTLGSAHAWLGAGGRPRSAGRLVQECGIGLVELRDRAGAWAFKAPGFLRSGPVGEEDLTGVLRALGLDAAQVQAAEWIDNGPGWLGLVLEDAATVLSLSPDFSLLTIETGVLGAHDHAEAERRGVGYEVRAFCPGHTINEDPVTGSLNAGFGVWLTRTGALPPAYVARQGTALGRDGRVQVRADDAGEVWVGGGCATVVRGSVAL